ncbi:site-specific integrase [Kocuria sp. SM24M-10]|uniref:tyrosine-type recombinase/integrase n=1 Tax=Kocuria sp. SM24M-10 TaxID=1660349 RepID=UPI0006496130|nr:site-specific integrase [Kocuria sp. SM24M-10]KLU08683.1 integrase [Kocuria sp. SM24M-10]
MATRSRTPRRPRSSFGQVAVLPSGRFRVRFTGPDGTRRTGPTTFATRSEAEAYLVQVHAELLRGNTLAVIPTTTTVADYLAAYLRDATTQLRPRTLDLYQRTAARWIVPAVGTGAQRVELGPLPLSGLSVGLVRQWHTAVTAAAHAAATATTAAPGRSGHPARAWATAEGLPVAATGQLPAAVLAAWSAAGCPTTAGPPPQADPHAGRTAAAQAYRLLRTVLGQAVRDGLIATNPAQVKGAGTAVHPERRPLEVPEVAALAAAVPPRYRAAVLVAAWSGLRPGELFALRRADVAEAGTAVRVERTLVEVPGRPITTGPPKSAAGRRTVALPATVAAELTTHLATHTGPTPDALVFTTGTGAPVHAAARSRIMAPARATIGREDVTWHHLRHTGATLAAVSGATQAELQRRIGHSTTRAAALYQHASTSRDQWIAAQLDTLATPTPPPGHTPEPDPTPEPPTVRGSHLRLVHSA